MRRRVALRLIRQMRRARRRPYRRTSSTKSQSGSCISKAVLAAVLPCPIRAPSSSPTRNPASANIHAAETPVMPPPTIATSTWMARSSAGRIGARGPGRATRVGPGGAVAYGCHILAARLLSGQG